MGVTGEKFQLGTVGALSLSVVSSVSILSCNKALMSSLGFTFGVFMGQWKTWPKKRWVGEIQMKKSCHGRAVTFDPQHCLSKVTGEAMKHQQCNIPGSQAGKNKFWKKRYLTFLSKFQNKMKHKKPDT